MFRSDSKSDERNPLYGPRVAAVNSKPSVAENVAPHSAERSPVGLSALLTPPGSAPEIAGHHIALLFRKRRVGVIEAEVEQVVAERQAGQPVGVGRQRKPG